MTAATAACLLLAAAAVGYAVWTRRRAARTMKRLERMLREAMDGDFREESFDETRLSALEARMRQYLLGGAAADRKLRRDKAHVESLISDLSHQIRTPVANLVLYAQLLSERPLPDDCRVCVQAIAEQAGKLRFLVDMLVKTSRLETGVFRLHPRRQPVSALLDRAARAVMPRAQAREMRLRLPETDQEATFDEKWTAEALENLLDNAVKYAPAGSDVTVTVQGYELFCRIDVTDCGPGIPEPEQSRVFQRFYRSPSVADREGVGIGLFLAREIASKQGGYLKLSSRPGQGSTFSLYLPRDSGHAVPNGG